MTMTSEVGTTRNSWTTQLKRRIKRLVLVPIVAAVATSTLSLVSTAAPAGAAVNSPGAGGWGNIQVASCSWSSRSIGITAWMQGESAYTSQVLYARAWAYSYTEKDWGTPTVWKQATVQYDRLFPQSASRPFSFTLTTSGPYESYAVYVEYRWGRPGGQWTNPSVGEFASSYSQERYDVPGLRGVFVNSNSCVA